MRLEKIKLSGFKSFVDSTSIPFTSDLVAVVGPNGCGKSNVIDAVRWVLGESSAKHLRGDQMADVIFNGSTTRKPVGQAFVELVFDNSDATISGEFAAYQQISLKRQVNREGQSVYFLNGTRCRRKDITDLFLGTGLGARSYAIIEQGTISRLIEAKPDELRVFLEEAAGISKYKERRRDTENRMRRTRENLERLADLCEEIEKQCRHLKRQAATAGKYKELKTQERQLKAQLLALRWRALDEQDERQSKNSQTLQNKVDELLARQREIEKDIELQRETHTAQRDTLNDVQASFYAVGSDIAKAEQALQHQQAQKQQQHAELERYQGILSTSKQELLDSEKKQSQLTEQIYTIEQDLIKAKASEDQSAKALNNAEQTMTHWQKTWDDFTYQVAEPKRTTDVEKTKINQLERQLMQSTQRLTNLKAEQARLQQHVVQQSDCEALQQQHDLAENQLQQTQHTLAASQQQISESQAFIQQESDALAEQRAERARLSGRLESILVLQQANLGESEQQVGRWLDDLGLADAAKIIDKIDVVAGWERAVEIVLGSRLQSVCVDDIEAVLQRAEQLPTGELSLFNTTTVETSVAPSKTSLASLVTANMPAMVLLKNVHVAPSLAQAKVLLAELEEHESVITEDGVWLHADGVSFNAHDAGDSILVLEKEKRKLTQQLSKLNSGIASNEQALASARDGLIQVEKQVRELRLIESDTVKKASQYVMQLSEMRSKIEQAQQRLQQIDVETAQLQTEHQRDSDSLASSRQALQTAIEQSAELEGQRISLQQQREAKKSALDAARREVHASRELTHSLMLQLESQRSSQALLVQNAESVKERMRLASDKLTEFQAQINLSDEPLDALQASLEAGLKKRQQVEADLLGIRAKAEATEHVIRELTTKRQQTEQQVQQAREDASSAQVDHQEVRVRKQTLVEQLEEAGVKLNDTLSDLPEQANDHDWQQQVTGLAEQIDRLGPINLTAIEEFETQSERKTYLDSQRADLMAALKTLETAIEKIDKESRFLFKQTFDKVNAGFERRFPKLFGGGHAYLQQTGDDLLETGVTVMARPPGKRNSSIHLLSGGEKALTAVALVFAIFDLNPSPFCMLDEVDAPLDEANVGRFGELVKEMSKTVQMILITHNKATMEMAQQLAGVTMKEPGVSRLVAVDIDEAVKMAAN